MATPDVDNITSGPAQVTLASVEIGHTAGGVAFTITPQNRARTVDQFGVSEVDIVHSGDECRMTIPWAEWTVAVLAEIYDPGNDQTTAGTGPKFIGIGRSSGYIYANQAAQIIPRLTADAAKLVNLFRVTPIGEISFTHNEDDDRIFETEFACLTDESQTDGNLIGYIQQAAS